MTRYDVQRWLDAYIAAWRSYDPIAIGDLFSEQAEYRYHPWEEPLRGREAIVEDWLANRDDPAGWDADYAPFAIEDDRVAVTGTSRYDDANGKRTYHNVFLCRFDGDGRCREFTELYTLQK